MAGKHRKRSRRATKLTAIGAVTVTATALTVGTAPPSDDDAVARVVTGDVDLTAAFRPFPRPDQIPDLTGGLGSAGYNFSQTAVDVLLRLIVENLNAAALAQAAGLDPQSVLDTLLGGVLGDIPQNLLDDVIGTLPIDISPVLKAILDPLNLGGLVTDQLSGLLSSALGIDDLNGLLGLLGLDLSDVLNLSGLDVPGVNIITAGPPFTLLKLLGVDLGWVPGLPNSVADEINNSDYLTVNLDDVVHILLDRTNIPLVEQILGGIVGTLPDIDVVDLRVPVVVGFGLGAFSAGMAYDQVRADLKNQPGGTMSSDHPLLGSFTVLPMLLLRNPGRGNGGLFARFFPIFGLAGIDTVTPETEVSHDGGLPLGTTGLSLGGANLIPVKVDGTVMYDPLSDFAAWPNPVSLANNLMAGLLPTYILRGLSLDTVPDQVESQVLAALANVAQGNPLALNIYLTLPSATLPLLEPAYLASDVLNLVTFGALPVNPFNLVANALAPALTSLANLGYTDVEYNPQTGAYERTLTDAGTPTAFGSLPDVDWGQVPGVVINQLLQGISKEFLSGNPTPGTPNALTNLLNLVGSLGLGNLLGGLDLGNIVGGVLGGLDVPGLTEQASTLAAATSVPSSDARMVTMSTEKSAAAESSESSSGTEDSGEESGSTEDGATGAADKDETAETKKTAADTDATDTDGTDTDATDDGKHASGVKPGPKHAKPDHANPVSSIVHGLTSVLGPKHAKPDNDSPSEKSTAGANSDAGAKAGASDNAA